LIHNNPGGVERELMSNHVWGIERELMFEGMSVMAYYSEEMLSKYCQTKYMKSTFERGPQRVETSIPKTKTFIEKLSFLIL
jgi:hypothetical protein